MMKRVSRTQHLKLVTLCVERERERERERRLFSRGRKLISGLQVDVRLWDAPTAGNVRVSSKGEERMRKHHSVSDVGWHEFQRLAVTDGAGVIQVKTNYRCSGYCMLHACNSGLFVHKLIDPRMTTLILLQSTKYLRVCLSCLWAISS